MIAKYFKISFKKPTLSADEEKLENRKIVFHESLEKNYSRLESIELLCNNSKFEDAHIILKNLITNILELIPTLFEKKNIQNPKDVFALISDQATSEILLKEFETLQTIANEKSLNEKQGDDAIISAQNLLYKLEKYFRKEKKGQFHTPVDDFTKRLFVQKTVAIGLVLLIVGSYSYRKIKYPAIKNDNVQVMYIEKDKEEYSPAKSVSTELKKENWQEYRFKFNKPKDIFKLRIDPVNQAKVRMQFKNIKLNDLSGKTIKERDFVMGADLKLPNYWEVEYLHQIKPGKLAPGKYVELVSTDDDPQVHLNFGKLNSVSEVILQFRVIEAHKRFKD